METSFNDIGATLLAAPSGATSPAEPTKQHLATNDLTTTVSQEEEATSVDRETLDAAVQQAQSRLAQNGVSLKFNVIETTGKIQVEMINAETDKVIRKFPPDELVKLSESLKKFSGGLLDAAI
jgi:flagellar protein FlaG